MSNYNSLKKRKEIIENEISALQEFLSQAPEGRLITRQRNSGRYDYSYCTKTPDEKKKEVHIPMSNKKLAEQLAWKYYANKRLKDCKKEHYALSVFLNIYGNDKEADILLKTHPGIGELILPQLGTRDEWAKKWQEADYVRSQLHPENLIYSTVNPALKVRSKAESDIISRLVYYHVPYRYEEQIIINGIVFHPDITCLKVKSRELFYWEHQGAWDKQDYVQGLPGRMDAYRSAGIIPWQNLIITTETSSHPLDINWVDTIIQYYLL